MNPRQVQDGADLPDKMIVGDRLIEAELIEQMSLVPVPPCPASAIVRQTG